MSANPPSLPVARDAPLPLAAPPAPAVAAHSRWAGLMPALRRTGPLLLWRIQRVGPAGLAGGGMLVFGLVFLGSTLLPQQGRLADMEHQLQALQGRQAPSESAPARLDRFVKTLPRRSDIPKVLGQVYAIAEASSITLDRGRYEMAPLRDGGFAEYRMSFPVKGRYTDIRRFIDGVLTQVPSVAVEGMRIERKSVGDGEVTADLRFAIMLKGTGS